MVGLVFRYSLVVFCPCEEGRGEERSSLFFLFVCGKVLFLSLVVSLGVGGFFSPSFGVKETKRKKRRRRGRRERVCNESFIQGP